MMDQIKRDIKKLQVTPACRQGRGYACLPARRGLRVKGFRLQVLMLLITLFFLAGCGKSLPSIDGLDIRKWKGDKNGCGGFRETVEELVIKQKDKLLSLAETDIVRLLGKPDETELYKRNEKFYKYYFSNGPGCSNSGKRKSITLRFNAVGLLKEAVAD